MPKANGEEKLSSDGEWIEDEWVVMEDDIHAKWVRTLALSLSPTIVLNFSDDECLDLD